MPRLTCSSTAACEFIRKVVVLAALLLVGNVAPAYAAEGPAALLWPVANFIILAGILWYFGRTPMSEYLQSRQATIRKELVEAAALRSAATTQLAEIEKKMQALPGELDALRARGREETAAEEARIAAAAAAERDRLLEQARREIDLQVRLARQELVTHAADLAMQLATDRVRKEITPADQDRLVDTYLKQVK